MSTNHKLFSSAEIRDFEKHPVYSASRRKDIFKLYPNLKRALVPMNDAQKVHFWVRYAYFKTSHMIIENLNKKDLLYAAKVLVVPENKIYSYEITRPTFRAHKDSILRMCKFKPFDLKSKKLVMVEIEQLLKLHKRPRTLWNCLLDILIDHKIEIPKYRKLEAIISKAKLNHIETNKATSQKLTRNASSLGKVVSFHYLKVNDIEIEITFIYFRKC
jgi:hypothetical protein